jgi:hypothetical protein
VLAISELSAISYQSHRVVVILSEAKDLALAASPFVSLRMTKMSICGNSYQPSVSVQFYPGIQGPNRISEAES